MNVPVDDRDEFTILRIPSHNYQQASNDANKSTLYYAYSIAKAGISRNFSLSELQKKLKN